MLGLPDGVTACLFDMDGVVTKTAVVHAAAWKQMFDEFLRSQPGQAPFDSAKEYDTYVDGKPRLEGTESFLESRHINLPSGESDDKPSAHTVYGLSNRKNELVLEVLKRDGVEVYPGSRRYIDAVRVDANVAKERGLHGKPAPDTFLEAARMLGVSPENAAVYEDALAGVAAGHAGKFGLVVGVDRVGQADELREHGADVVVKDLADLL